MSSPETQTPMIRLRRKHASSPDKSGQAIRPLKNTCEASINTFLNKQGINKLYTDENELI